jgi:hypothetical protein
MLDFTIGRHRSPLSFLEVTNTERCVITSDLGARALDILIQKNNWNPGWLDFLHIA